MKENQLNRLLQLVKKTGDKLVVLDQASDHATVMLSLDSYEHLVDQGGNLGWSDPSTPLGAGGAPGPTHPDDFPTSLETDEPAEEVPAVTPEDVSAYQAIAKEELKDEAESHGAIPEYVPGKKRLDFSENWAAENSKPISEEDLKDVPEEEEEKFYLEPVE